MIIIDEANKITPGMMKILKDLAKRQRPLDAEFAKVWDENVDKLHEE